MKDRPHERNKAEGGRLENVSGSLLVRRFSVREPRMYRVIETVSVAKLTSIDKAALCELAQAVMDLEYDGLDGDLLQAGCGLGGAAIVIAHAKRRGRLLSAHDPLADVRTQERIGRELAAHGADERLNVRFLSGPYESTLAPEGGLALAHLDSGEYGTMRLLLERLVPRILPGGRLIIDDYATRPECRKAVDEHFHGKKGFNLVRKGRLHVIKS